MRVRPDVRRPSPRRARGARSRERRPRSRRRRDRPAARRTLSSTAPRCGMTRRPLAEDVRCEDIQLGRLVDRFHRVLAEQLIAPGDEVVEVLHHDRRLVRGRSQSREEMWIERVLAPLLDLVFEIFAERPRRGIGAVVVEQLEQLFDRLRCGVLVEGTRPPEPLAACRRPRRPSGRRCSGTSAARRRNAGSWSAARRSATARGRTAPSCTGRRRRRS